MRDLYDPIIRRPSSRPADAHVVCKQTLSLTSWNLQTYLSRRVARSELILDRIFKGPKFPDIIFLQEVSSSIRQVLLSDPRIRSSFLTTDAEDDTSFKGVPFAAMTLLSSKRFRSPLLAEDNREGASKIVLDSVFRTQLTSRYKRDALCVNIAAPTVPGSILRLLNVHLDPFDSQFIRFLQMDVLAGLLREPGCSGGIIAGDFNAVYPRDHALIDEHELVDAWVALHGPDGGATWGHWGVPVEIEDEFEPGRLDKVVMLGLQPVEVDVLQPGLIGACTHWSEHRGLHCTFTI